MIIKRDPDIIKCYFEDESGLLGGNASEVISPEEEKEVVEVLKDLGSKKTPSTISGGGTGVTGARVPFGGTILATDSLNKILDINKKDLTLTAQPGARISEIQEEVSKLGLIYPPDPTEKSAFLGGTVSTNASGARGFKHGSTRDYIKRLKIVLSNGEILDIKRGKYITKNRDPFILKLRDKEIKIPIPRYKMPDVKNASGYYIENNMDLIDIFIGSEGTLGFITEVAIALKKGPEEIMSFFSFFSKEKDALSFIEDAKKYNALTFEYMDKNSLELLRGKFPTIPENAASMVYFEEDYEKKDEERLSEQWIRLLEEHNSLSEKTLFADTEKERNKLREIRHALPETINEIVKKNKLPKVGTDIAVPGNRFSEMYSFYKERLSSSKIDHLIFGHIGESHMHVNMLPKNEEEYIKSRSVYMDFVKKAVSLGGTVSAEHGIGKLKHAFLEAMYGKDAIMEMVRLKKSLDPACILGLDNIFSKELLIKNRA
ncbi:MAG: FAD-linked oxidase C-terminal domain-containing protein [Candidatus Omnitrophota bacterium]